MTSRTGHGVKHNYVWIYQMIAIMAEYTMKAYMNLINTLRPRQDGRHFPDDTFKCIFLNENV